MVADIDRNDFFLRHQQFQRNAEGKIDRNRMQPLKPPAQRVQVQSGMEGVGFEQLQGFEVLQLQLGMPFEKAACSPGVLPGEGQRIAHSATSSRAR